VVVGSVLLVDTKDEPAARLPVPTGTEPEEERRFERARAQAREELRTLRDRIRTGLGDAYAGMLEAQLLILEDPSLLEEIRRRIAEDHSGAEGALDEAMEVFLRRFESLDDGFFRERGGDLADVHRRLRRLLRGTTSGPAEVPDGPLVVVAHALGPSDALLLMKEGVVGLATDAGGRTSHTAILAQSLSLPAVVGLHDISNRVRTGDRVILDGGTGRIEVLPGPEALEAARRSIEVWQDHVLAMASAADLPVVTRDGVEVVLRANIERIAEVEAALRYGARGIGLYRSEFLFLARAPALPSEEDHYRTYRELAERVAPNPAVVRTLDLGGEKYFHEVLERSESNPVLGLRAVRLCLGRPDIFLPQIRGLLRASVHADLRVMLPLVTTVEEVRDVRRLIAREAEALRARGVPCRADVPVGIMVEVPAAALTADLLARECDFFSLGTNDLIQYAMAVDRSNELVAYLYQPLHPSILRMLSFVIRAGTAAGMPVSLCGEMAADPSMTALLLGLGLREFSMHPHAIAAVREAIRGVAVEGAEAAVFHALGESTAREVERRLGGEE
jgi:phosphoenolpyruvate-protein phosphotransferase (PTS system enzyme I)